MIDGVSAQIDDVAAVTPVQVGHLAGAPVFGGDESDGRARKPQAFPPFHFVHFFKAQTVDQIANTVRDDNGLVGGNPAQTLAVEMIEMGVGDKNQVDVGQMMMRETGMAQSADHQEPIGPVGVDQDIAVGSLNQKGGMADPGEANLPGLGLREDGSGAIAMATLTYKEGGKEDVRDESVRLLPTGMGRLRTHS